MIPFLPSFPGFKILNDVLSIFNLTYNLSKQHRRCAIGRQHVQCNMESACTYVSMFILGEREREDERGREKNRQTEKKNFEQE